MFELFIGFCILFTAYYCGAIAFHTLEDLKEEPKTPRWPFIKKFGRKFWKNFIYQLP